MSLPEKVLKRITDILSYISIFTITTMMLLAVLDVFLRIFFKSPIVGATELIQILNVGIILALGTGSLANQNVTVDFVMDKVPLMPRIVIELIMDLINLALMIAVIITSFSLMLRSMERNSSYSLLRIPEWPFIILVVLGFIGCVAAIILIMVRRIRELTTGNKADKVGLTEERR